MSDQREPVVKVRAASKIYRQGTIDVAALSDVDLDIHDGDFAVLAGPSGSGKTTLLNLIGALDTPTSGSISLDGKPLSDFSSSRLAELRLRRFGFVFQAYNLIPVLSAYENAEYVMLLQGVPAAERKKRVLEVLESVGRVAIARALAAKPTVMLADEPTANLDSRTGADLTDLMRELNREHGVTFIISSHDPKVIERADRVIELEDGRIVADRCTGEDAA